MRAMKFDIKETINRFDAWSTRYTLGIVSGIFTFLAASQCAFAAELDVVKSPVPLVLDNRLTVHTSSGTGEVPIHVSKDWTTLQTDITRAVIIVHGWPRRDVRADEYISQRAGAAAHNTLFITPQFLIDADVVNHQLPAKTLRWSTTGWRQGYDAVAPAPISSFDVIDNIFQQLADHSRFPNLKKIVLAGHSAGGQFVQRYAVVGHGEDALSAADIHVRYVVANPASYLYFDNQRLQAEGSFVSVDEESCAGLNDWNLGLAGKLPSYVTQPISVDQIKKSYWKRDVVYLLGTADNDPNADALGSSCRYKIQGPTRYARGLAYASYVRLTSQGRANHQVVEVANVSHHPYAMYASAFGMAALLDAPGCQSK